MRSASCTMVRNLSIVKGSPSLPDPHLPEDDRSLGGRPSPRSRMPTRTGLSTTIIVRAADEVEGSLGEPLRPRQGRLVQVEKGQARCGPHARAGGRSMSIIAGAIRRSMSRPSRRHASCRMASPVSVSDGATATASARASLEHGVQAVEPARSEARRRDSGPGSAPPPCSRRRRRGSAGRRSPRWPDRCRPRRCGAGTAPRPRRR